MAPVETNATIAAVAGGGFTAEPGASAAAGADPNKFTGAARAYYREQRRERPSGQGRTIVLERTLVVDTRDPAIEWKVDDVVTFSRDGIAGVFTGEVERAVAARLDAVAGSGVETTRVELAPLPAP